MAKKHFIIFFILILTVITVVSGCFKKEAMQVPENNIKKPPIAATTETEKEPNKVSENINKYKDSEIEEEFEVDHNFFSSVSIADGDEVIIKSLDKSGIFREIKKYNRKTLRGNYAQEFYLNYEPTIFISGIGSSGYTTIDLAGEETSEKNIFLKDKKFSAANFIKYPNENKIVYALGPGAKGTSQPIYIFDYEKNNISQIKSKILPNGLISSRVIGWSKNHQFFYASKIGWEGHDYAGLWKVSVNNKSVASIAGVNKITLGELNVAPYLDLAVGIESKEVKCDNCMTEITDGPPSKLIFFNLKTNNRKIILTSDNFILHSPILSPDGKKIFYSEKKSNDMGDVYAVNIDGSDKKLIAEGAAIRGISKNGKKIIIELLRVNIFKILDLGKSSEKIISFSDVGDKTEIKFLSCNYPLGYSCLYPQY